MGNPYSNLQKDILKDESKLNLADAADLIAARMFPIIHGGWAGAVLFDQQAAYRLARQFRRLKVSREPILMSDGYFSQIRRKVYSKVPILTVGGPEANNFSRQLCLRHELLWYGTIAGIIERRRKPPIGYAWGPHINGTLKAVDDFESTHLNTFAKYL